MCNNDNLSGFFKENGRSARPLKEEASRQQHVLTCSACDYKTVTEAMPEFGEEARCPECNGIMVYQS